MSRRPVDERQSDTESTMQRGLRIANMAARMKLLRGMQIPIFLFYEACARTGWECFGPDFRVWTSTWRSVFNHVVSSADVTRIFFPDMHLLAIAHGGVVDSMGLTAEELDDWEDLCFDVLDAKNLTYMAFERSPFAIQVADDENEVLRWAATEAIRPENRMRFLDMFPDFDHLTQRVEQCIAFIDHIRVQQENHAIRSAHFLRLQSLNDNPDEPLDHHYHRA